jgi:hypothetical protein
MDIISDSVRNGSNIRFNVDHVSFLIEVFVIVFEGVLDIWCESGFCTALSLGSVVSVKSSFGNLYGFLFKGMLDL